MRWQYFDYQPHGRIYVLLDGGTVEIEDVVHVEQCGDLHRVSTSSGKLVVLPEWKYWRIKQ